MLTSPGHMAFSGSQFNPQYTSDAGLDNMFGFDDIDLRSSDFDSLEEDIFTFGQVMTAHDSPEEQYINPSDMMHSEQHAHPHTSISDGSVAIPSPHQPDQANPNMSIPSQHTPGPHTPTPLPEQNVSDGTPSPSPPRSLDDGLSPSPSSSLSDKKRKDNPSGDDQDQDQDTPKKKTRGRSKGKKPSSPEEAEEKKKEKQNKNKQAAVRCRQKKKEGYIQLKAKEAAVQAEHPRIKQGIHQWEDELKLVLDDYRQEYEKSMDSKLLVNIHWIEARLEGLSTELLKQYEEFGRKVAVFNANMQQETSDVKATSGEIGSHKSRAMSRSCSGSSTTSQIGRVRQSRTNSMQSNLSGKSTIHDSGVSDLDTPVEQTIEGLEIRSKLFAEAETKAQLGPNPYHPAVYNPQLRTMSQPQMPHPPMICHPVHHMMPHSYPPQMMFHSYPPQMIFYPPPQMSQPQMLSNQRIYDQLVPIDPPSFQPHEMSQRFQPYAFQPAPAPGSVQMPAQQAEGLNGDDMIDPILFIANGGLGHGL